MGGFCRGGELEGVTPDMKGHGGELEGVTPDMKGHGGELEGVTPNMKGHSGQSDTFHDRAWRLAGSEETVATAAAIAMELASSLVIS